MMFLMQTTSPNHTPVTIDGAVILLLLALVASAPTLLGALGKVVSAVADRLNAGTSAQVRQLDVFKILEDEVKHLRDERDADQRRLTEAERKASEAELKVVEAARQAERFQKDLDAEKEKRQKMQFDLDQMKARLDNEINEKKAKDDKIAQQQQRIYELEAENASLKQKLQEKTLDPNSSRSSNNPV